MARADEHADISELALRSKSYWGYSKEFLDACRDELTFYAAVCASGMAWVAAEGSTLVGVSVITGAPPIGELAGLFVDLPAIGTGCGRMLLTHTLHAAREHGFAEPLFTYRAVTRRAPQPQCELASRLQRQRSCC